MGKKKKKKKKINWQVVGVIAALIGSIASLVGAIVALIASITSGALSQAFKSKVLQLSSGSDPTTVGLFISCALLVIYTLLLHYTLVKTIKVVFSEEFRKKINEAIKNSDRGL